MQIYDLTVLTRSKYKNVWVKTFYPNIFVEMAQLNDTFDNMSCSIRSISADELRAFSHVPYNFTII
jgi:hypothetical protein